MRTPSNYGVISCGSCKLPLIPLDISDCIGLQNDEGAQFQTKMLAFYFK